VYGRRVAGETLAFGHEGLLYRGSFVLYDRGTRSLWVHVTGECVAGPLAGERLEFLPSVVTTWAEWRAAHPNTTVLLGRRRGGFMGTFAVRGRLQVYGLSVGDPGRDPVLLAYTALAEEGFVEVEVEGRPVLAVLDLETFTAAAFRAEAGGRRLTFAAAAPAGGDPRVRDAETGSLWAPLRGECLAGPLAGARLEQVVATPWVVSRWREHYPDGRIVGGAD